jgi:hypothetical protein
MADGMPVPWISKKAAIKKQVVLKNFITSPSNTIDLGKSYLSAISLNIFFTKTLYDRILWRFSPYAE